YTRKSETSDRFLGDETSLLDVGPRPFRLVRQELSTLDLDGGATRRLTAREDLPGHHGGDIGDLIEAFHDLRVRALNEWTVRRRIDEELVLHGTRIDDIAPRAQECAETQHHRCAQLTGTRPGLHRLSMHLSLT